MGSAFIAGNGNTVHFPFLPGSFLLIEQAELKEMNTESPAGFSVSSPGSGQRGPVLSRLQVSGQHGWPRCLWRMVRGGGASETWGFN